MANTKNPRSVSSDSKTDAAVLPIREISSSAWIPFFSDFNNRHNGQRVDLDILDSEEGRPRTELKQRPLQSVSSMLGRPGEPAAISITVSLDDLRLASRNIPDVRQVRLYQIGGEDEKLEIESADGVRTIIVFRR